MARPSELTPEIRQAAADYLQGGYADNGERIPTASGLALHLGKSKAALYGWKDENEDFAAVMEAIQAKQETMLINGGLGGDYNAAIAKLLLANHGYSDKQNIDHTSGGKAMQHMPTEIRLVVPEFDDWSEAAKDIWREEHPNQERP